MDRKQWWGIQISRGDYSQEIGSEKKKKCVSFHAFKKNLNINLNVILRKTNLRHIKVHWNIVSRSLIYKKVFTDNFLLHLYSMFWIEFELYPSLGTKPGGVSNCCSPNSSLRAFQFPMQME